MSTFHDKLTTFWKRLPEAAIVEDTRGCHILKLADGNFLGNDDFGASLYIRRHYENLFTLINQLVEGSTELARKPCKWSVIVGSPGIGKMYFLYWILWKLSTSMSKGKEKGNKSKSIILHTDEEVFKFTLSDPAEAVFSHNVNDFTSDLKDPNTWYLVKGNTPYFGACAKTIIITSPDRNKWYKLCKKRLAHRFYMPPFSLEELLECRVLFPRVSEPEVIERFERFGGMIRTVLEVAETGDSALMDLFGDVVGGLSDQFPKHLQRIEYFDHSPGLHRIIHLDVTDTETYSTCDYRFSTHYQAKLAFDRFWAHKSKLEDTFRYLDTLTRIPAIFHELFTLTVSSIMQSAKGAVLKLRCLEDDQDGVDVERELDFVHLAHLPAPFELQWQIDDILLIATSKYDSSTASLSPTFGDLGVDVDFSALSDCVECIVYLVPWCMSTDFRKVKIRGDQHIMSYRQYVVTDLKIL